MSDSTASGPPYARVKEALLEALDLPPGAVEAWLTSLGQADPALADRVRHLIDAHERAGSFLDLPDEGLASLARPAADARTSGSEPASPRPTRIGAFTIERELGQGGMGTVLLGSRREGGFVQQVAIKVIRGAAIGPSAAARLTDERRILASLGHPAIAHFVDGGTTDEGSPYLAMEFVDGVPITRYCDEQRLSTRARVQLFLKVCDAVRFAHTRLVIHRDIKPSNILVTADGTPKLLDFGIAKLLDPLQASDAPTVPVLTPHYASPEQAAGAAVTTATDVYSLGVLLYEVLTGEGPYRSVSGDSPLLAVLQAIRLEEPERPSVAARRHGRTVDEDLDAVLLKALRKEEAGRYGSVGELMDDLVRQLEGRPVLAHDGSGAYRLRRFVSRNRAAVVAGTVALASLVAAAGISTWQAQVARRERARADERFADVRSLANAVVGPLYDAISRVPGSTEARQTLVKEALSYLDRLAKVSADDLQLKAELADAYLKIGDVQGNLFNANLGDVPGSKASYARLLDLRQAVYDRRPSDPAAARGLGIAHSRIGDIALGEGRADDGVAAYGKALEIFERMTDRSEQTLVAHSSVLQHLAVTLNWADRKDEAIARFDQAIRMIEPLAQAPGASEEVRRSLLSARGNLGDVHYYREEYDKALALFREAERTAVELQKGSKDPALEQRNEYLITGRVAATLAELGDLDAALASRQHALEIQTALAERDPRNMAVQFDLANDYQSLGILHYRREDYRLALEALDRSRRTAEAALAVSPDQRSRLFDLADTLAWMGKTYLGQGRPQAAVDILRKALEMGDAPDVAARKPAEQFEFHQWLGDALEALSQEHGSAGAAREARQSWQTALDGYRKIQATGELPTSYIAQIPLLEQKLGR
ncbi:MAG: protein kinase [Vicinamibacterales bacterium]